MAKTIAKKKWNLTGTLLVLFVFGALIAVLTRLTLGVIETSPVKDVSIPGRLVGMALTNTVTGEAALQQLAELHGKEVSLASGYIAHYKNREREAIAWVGITRTVEQARQLSEAMTRRIKQGNRYFTNLRTEEVGDLQVYRLDGADGMAHYYYQKANKVIWIGIGGEQPEVVTREAVRVTW